MGSLKEHLPFVIGEKEEKHLVAMISVIFIGLACFSAGFFLYRLRGLKNASGISAVYGEMTVSEWLSGYARDVVFFMFAIAILIMALLAILIGILLKHSRKLDSPILAMGIGVLFVALWLIFNSGLYRLAFSDTYLSQTISYITMLLIPYPFFYYLDMLQEHRYRTGYAFLALYLEIMTICCLLLHFAEIAVFPAMMPFCAFTMGVMITGAVVTLVLDYKGGYYKKYILSFAGMTGFIISGILELILLQAVKNRRSGSMILAGLYWTLALGIIHQLYAVREAQQRTAMAIRASETKTNFLANMSHEIRTPMNAILGMDEMILREAKGNEKITKYASDIKSAGNMLLSIINDILDLSKIESGKAELIPVDFEICSVINDIINITKRRADDKGLTFSFDAASDIPVRLHGDEIRVRQVMLNVINNAVKYTEKGEVTVNIRQDKESAEQHETDNTVMIVVTVKDTGTGIKEEDLSKLFQPFDRLEESKNRKIEGTGLGLNIANQYIRMMGGRIEVESVYGEGSVFTLYMPLQIVDSTPIGDFTAAIRAHANSGDDYRPVIIAPNARVLVVDDNEMNLEVISGLMESTQIKVDTALSGPEGIEMMDRRRYDLIFLDQMMPGMDGISTLDIMRSKYDMRGISAIALTADAVAGAKEFYLEKGFDDYLSKPVKSEALEKMLIKHLPPALLLTKEDIDRITEANERRTGGNETAGLIVVADSDGDALKTVRSKLDGIYRGTYVTDLTKAGKFLKKHDVRYVMMSRELFENNFDPDEG